MSIDPGMLTSVFVDPESDAVDVDHDGSVEHDQVAAVLMRLGYPEHGTGGTLEKAKSYISCAIGRIKGED